MPQIPQPPSSFTGATALYLSLVAQIIRGIPNVSYFTQQTPNGNVLGVNGDWAIYNGSTSTNSHIWVNQSAATASQTSAGWGLVGFNIVTPPPPVITSENIVASGTVSIATTTVVVRTMPPVAGDITVQLPLLSSVGTGHQVYVSQITSASTNNTYLQGSSSQVIEGSSLYTLGPNTMHVGVISSGTMWYVASCSSL
jgi:hypothetical protein